MVHLLPWKLHPSIPHTPATEISPQSKSGDTKPLLQSHHWLSIPFVGEFKLLSLAGKSHHGIFCFPLLAHDLSVLLRNLLFLAWNLLLFVPWPTPSPSRLSSCFASSMTSPFPSWVVGTLPLCGVPLTPSANLLHCVLFACLPYC